jgi:hypothetical protein
MVRGMRNAFVVALAVTLLCATAVQSAFLADKLPLKVVSLTPFSQSASPVTLRATDCITAIFSRPVIALGSDFGPMTDQPGGLALSQEQIPFFITVADGQVSVLCSFCFRFDFVFFSTLARLFSFSLSLSLYLFYSPSLPPSLSLSLNLALTCRYPPPPYRWRRRTRCDSQRRISPASTWTRHGPRIWILRSPSIRS